MMPTLVVVALVLGVVGMVLGARQIAAKRRRSAPDWRHTGRTRWREDRRAADWVKINLEKELVDFTTGNTKWVRPHAFDFRGPIERVVSVGEWNEMVQGTSV